MVHWASVSLPLYQSLNVASTQDYIKCSENFCLPQDYDKGQLPPTKEGEPIKVAVEFEIVQFTKMEDREFWIEVTMFMTLLWNDTRLYRSNTSAPVPNTLPLGLDFASQIWVPDLYIYNLKSASTRNILTQFAGLWIKNGKTLHYSFELHAKFWCKMRFGRFPFDSHNCAFKVGSYGYMAEVMQFSEEFIKYDGDSFQQATLLDYDIGKPVSLQNPMYNWLGYGNYSLTGFEVLLTRHRGRYLMYTHMPSALFVCVSWISFIVPVEAIPGRITLLVTLLLVLINIFNTSVDHQPLSDTITAGSAWILTCIYFVFGALLAYAGLLYIKFWGADVESIKVTPPGMTKEKITLEQRLKTINRRFLVLFILLFLLFNLLYWPLLIH